MLADSRTEPKPHQRAARFGLALENIALGQQIIVLKRSGKRAKVAQSTVANYMDRHMTDPSKTWRTFLANHNSTDCRIVVSGSHGRL